MALFQIELFDFLNMPNPPDYLHKIINGTYGIDDAAYTYDNSVAKE